MKESKIEKQIVDHAKSLGWHVLKFVSPSKRGVPDRIFFKSGIVLFMEIKKEGEPPRRQQIKRLKELNDQNIPAFVVDDIDQGKKIINQYEKTIEL